MAFTPEPLILGNQFPDRTYEGEGEGEGETPELESGGDNCST